MPVQVLTAVEVAEFCYLWEAVLWVAVYRYPLVEFTVDGEDARRHPDVIEGLRPNVKCDRLLTTEECALAGLATNPEYEELKSGEPPESVEYLERVLGECDPEHREVWNQRLAYAKDIARRQAIWNDAFDALADRCQVRLFLALQDGTLTAWGKPLPRTTIETSISRLDTAGGHDWYQEDWQSIPASFWRSSGIKWLECHAEGRGNAHGHIQIGFEDLQRLFPAPPAQPADDVVKIGTSLVISPGRTMPIVVANNRGRKPFPWEAFHVEIALRLRGGSLPNKREAFIAEMHAWCLKQWGRDVGRSTILQKLKPYYDALEKADSLNP